MHPPPAKWRGVENARKKSVGEGHKILILEGSFFPESQRTFAENEK